jgi:hypothetical protein
MAKQTYAEIHESNKQFVRTLVEQHPDEMAASVGRVSHELDDLTLAQLWRRAYWARGPAAHRLYGAAAACEALAAETLGGARRSLLRAAITQANVAHTVDVLVRIQGADGAWCEVKPLAESLCFSHNERGPDIASFACPVEIEVGGVLVWEGDRLEARGVGYESEAPDGS